MSRNFRFFPPKRYQVIVSYSTIFDFEHDSKIMWIRTYRYLWVARFFKIMSELQPLSLFSLKTAYLVDLLPNHTTHTNNNKKGPSHE